VTAAATYTMTPKSRASVTPRFQPVAYSHALHAGQLGLDCATATARWKSPGFAKPADGANLHETARPGSDASPLLARGPAELPDPDNRCRGVQIHEVPDFVYFKSRHSHQPRRQLASSAMANQSDDVVAHAKSPQHGLLPRLPSQSRRRTCGRAIRDQSRLEKRRVRNAQLAMAPNSSTTGKVNPPQSCSGCHR